MRDDQQLVSTRQVIPAEQLHRAGNPYDMIIHTQIMAEEEVRRFAAEHELTISPLRTTWECRVEAITQ